MSYFIFYETPWRGGRLERFEHIVDAEKWLNENKENTDIVVIKGDEIEAVKKEVVIKWELNV